MTPSLRTTVLGLLLLPGWALAQASSTQWETDARKFDADYWQAFNTCDVQKMTAMNAEDLEFYHDLGGLQKGRASFSEAMSKNICGKPDWRLRRGEVPGTVKVYPLRSNGAIYGAVISGEHYFYHLNKGQPEKLEGRARFVHTLLVNNGVWQVARVLSFDHGPAK